MRLINSKELVYILIPFLVLLVSVLIVISGTHFFIMPLLEKIDNRSELTRFYKKSLDDTASTQFVVGQLDRLIINASGVYAELKSGFSDTITTAEQVQLIHAIAKKKFGKAISFEEIAFNPIANDNSKTVLIKMKADFNAVVKFCETLERLRHSVRIQGIAIENENEDNLSFSLLLSFNSEK